MIEINNHKEMFTSTVTVEKFGAVTNTQQAILNECNRLATFLIEKNKSYGNSALEPVRIFSSSNNIEQLKVRIDDKLSRLMKGTEFLGDNDIDDLMGYLVLLSIALKETWK